MGRSIYPEATWDNFSEKIFPAMRLATLSDLLGEEGVSPGPIRAAAGLADDGPWTPDSRVSLDQILAFYEAMIEAAPDPGFAYRLGRRLHTTAFGMYGLAILCSPDHRRTMRFVVQYHRLGVPLTVLTFLEEGRLAAWKIDAVPHPRITAPLYRFLIDMQLGIHTTVLRDIMGPTFAPLELRLSFARETDGEVWPEAERRIAKYCQSENRFVFDAAWLDRRPKMGSAATSAMLQKICEEQLKEMKKLAGTAGRVRTHLIAKMGQPVSGATVARALHLSERSLRRRLGAEGTSLREIQEELKFHCATKYLRDTAMTLEDIAQALAFSDTANFRRAFRRWTGTTPGEFRGRWASLH